MTLERKAEVNRRLAEFEGYADIDWAGDLDIEGGEYLAGDDPSLLGRVRMPDYIADLNALARLEAKLPTHWWKTYYEQTPDNKLFNVQVFLASPGQASIEAIESTEAEARAECIAQYLESRENKCEVLKGD